MVQYVNAYFAETCNVSTSANWTKGFSGVICCSSRTVAWSQQKGIIMVTRSRLTQAN